MCCDSALTWAHQCEPLNILKRGKPKSNSLARLKIHFQSERVSLEGVNLVQAGLDVTDIADTYIGAWALTGHLVAGGSQVLAGVGGRQLHCRKDDMLRCWRTAADEGW